MMLSVLEVIDPSTRSILRNFWETPIAQTATWSPTPFIRQASNTLSLVQDTLHNSINHKGLKLLFDKIS